jgi:hypothetical protein
LFSFLSPEPSTPQSRLDLGEDIPLEGVEVKHCLKPEDPDSHRIRDPSRCCPTASRFEFEFPIYFSLLPLSSMELFISLPEEKHATGTVKLFVSIG